MDTDAIVLDCCGRVCRDTDNDTTWGPDSVDDQLAVCAYGHGCYSPVMGACAVADGLHCCTFCGSVMRLLLLPAADGSGKRLCCWGCEAAGRMDHVCWVDDTYCRDCGATAAAEHDAVARRAHAEILAAALVLEDEPVPAGYAAAGMGEW